MPTTWEAMRDRQVELMKALAPTKLSTRRFRLWEGQNHPDFFSFADASQGAFRVFEIEHSFDYQDEKPNPGLDSDSDVHSMKLSIAYPKVRDLAGQRLEYVIAADIADVVKLLGQRGYGSYVTLGAGEHVATRTNTELVELQAARVLRLTFQLDYDRAIP